MDLLKEHFEGSTKNENIITTADGKYDIIVDEKLNIKVEKNKENNPEDKEEEITYNITLDKTEIVKEKMAEEATETITATIEPSVEGLVWESSNEDIAVISGEGNERTITIKPFKGEAIIKVSYGEAYAECKITVTIDPSEGMVPVIEKAGVFANNANIKEVREGNIPIPTGFSYVKGTKDGGAIVVDGSGNEFVWVPVDKFSDFAVLQGATTNYRGQLWATSVGNTFGTKNTTYNANSGLREPAVVTGNSSGTGTSYDGAAANKNAIWESSKYTSGLLEQFQDEYNYMAESVKTYGGFFVGRYETSWDGTKVASVKTTEAGQVMTGATLLEDTWATSTTSYANKATWYGLYDKQKELYTRDSSASVVSGMIYGAQHDAIMNWMSDVENQNVEGAYYIKDSTGMGWYSGVSGNSSHLTGLDYEGVNNKVKNIYDLAGNYYEWTQEAYTTYYRVSRGGYYRDVGSDSPASGSSYSCPVDASDYVSSRLQLYIK